VAVEDRYGNELNVGDEVFVIHPNHSMDEFPLIKPARLVFISEYKKIAVVQYDNDPITRTIGKEMIVRADEPMVSVIVLSEPPFTK